MGLQPRLGPLPGSTQERRIKAELGQRRHVVRSIGARAPVLKLRTLLASGPLEACMTSERLSVVIPAFNAATTIRSAVRSTLRQTVPVLEVIVVDDGSTDATAEAVTGIDDLRVRLVSRANGGPSAARNAGIAVARGEWVAFLDSDDLWLPRYVEAATAALTAAPNPGFAYTDAYVFHAGRGQVKRGSAMDALDPPPPDRASFLAALLRRNFVFTSATVPATVLSALGGYDESLPLSEEYDLWLRILVAGFDPLWMGGPLAIYRMHPGQSSHQILAMKRTAARVYHGLREDDMPSDDARAALLERRAASDREVAIVAGEAGRASRARRARNALGWIRKRAGLTWSWYDEPPAEITDAFGDLRVLDRDQA
jgi:glycosyltransferase involved in cell wall biosynthesis